MSVLCVASISAAFDILQLKLTFASPSQTGDTLNVRNLGAVDSRTAPAAATRIDLRVTVDALVEPLISVTTSGDQTRLTYLPLVQGSSDRASDLADLLAVRLRGRR